MTTHYKNAENLLCGCRKKIAVISQTTLEIYFHLKSAHGFQFAWSLFQRAQDKWGRQWFKYCLRQVPLSIMTMIQFTQANIFHPATVIFDSIQADSCHETPITSVETPVILAVRQNLRHEMTQGFQYLYIIFLWEYDYVCDANPEWSYLCTK